MATRLATDLVERVLERLGLSGPPAPDLEGLRLVYEAWSRAVPFDNLRKRIHVHAKDPGPLPGDAPTEFLEAWLAWGAGGTCWAGNGALHALLEALGFDALRGVATMLAVPVPDLPPNHGTVAVDLDGERWLVDASMISVEPLLLRADETTALPHPARGLRCESREGRYHVRWNPGFREPFECRIESFGADAAEFAERHEQTRGWSPFNFGLMVRQNRGDEVVGIGLGRRLRIRADGAREGDELSDDERAAWLVDALGYAESLVHQLPPDEPMPSPSQAS